MGEIKFIINGQEVSGKEGETILEAATRLGFHIPTLCHREELKPSGICRVCVVEVEKALRLVASCHTPISEGMVIHTDSPKVLLSRRITLELLMAGHSGPCVSDSHAESCELHAIASKMELGPPRFSVSKPRNYPIEEDNPYIIRDMSRCILCRRCVAACREIAEHSVLSIGYRGSETKVIVGMDQCLDLEVCRDCGICVEYCPTSALKWIGEAGNFSSPPSRESGKQEVDNERSREGLLEELKREQQESGFINVSFIENLKDDFKTTVGEVYGLTSFYSFLSTRPMGRNVIRVCKSLPCFLKNGHMLLEAIESAIGIRLGETTKDGRFSLELTNCIGACDQAPAIMINNDIHGPLQGDDIPQILGGYE